MATKNGSRPRLVSDDISDDVSGFDGLGASAYVDSSGTVHIDTDPITAKVPTSTPKPAAQPSTSIVTRNENEQASIFSLDFLQGEIFGLPKWLVLGAGGFAIYWFFFRKKGRR